MNEKTVVDLNVWVVDTDVVEGSGSIGLTCGKHSFRVEYFKEFGPMILEVNYSGPGITRQPVRANLFYSKL